MFECASFPAMPTNLLLAGNNRLVPLRQILHRPAVEVSEQQVRIAAVGPESVKEHHEWFDFPRVGEEIVDFDAFVISCIPGAILLGIGHKTQAILPSSALQDGAQRRLIESPASITGPFAYRNQG